jgi:hypothetical protein
VIVSGLRWKALTRRWLLLFLVVETGLRTSAAAAESQSADGSREAAVTFTTDGKAGFTFLTPTQTGVTFTNLVSQWRHLTNQILLNGSGVAAGDVDGDGWCDLFFCALDRPNALYRNLGNWKFEDISAAGRDVLPGGSCTGAALADPMATATSIWS